MKFAVLLLALSLPLFAQSTPPPAPKEKTENEKQVDAKLHADVIKLVEISGAREKLQDSLKPTVGEGRKAVMSNCKDCAPEFGEEWEKRMLERLKVEDFLSVYVRVYEKYLTEEDVTDLIAFHKARKESPGASLPPRLKEKLEPLMPTILSEIMGDCTRIGAKLGGEVGAEIGKEHPEYLGPKDKAEKP